MKKEKRLIKYFTCSNEKINENLAIVNFPTFEISFDKSIYSEFKPGQYRCKRCRKYLKLSNLTCRHLSTCRIFFNFKKNEKMNEAVNGGYNEINDSNINDIFPDIEESINNIFNKHEKNYEKTMMERINQILSRKNINEEIGLNENLKNLNNV